MDLILEEIKWFVLWLLTWTLINDLFARLLNVRYLYSKSEYNLMVIKILNIVVMEILRS